MSRTVVLLVAIIGLTLTGCSGDEEREKQEISAVAVTETGASTEKISDGTTYMDFTNATDASLDTLWFKLDSPPEAGLVDITRCAEPWTSTDACEPGATSVLPAVDLPGWQFALASGSTNLAPGEKAYLKFEVKGASEPVSFTVSSKEPKDNRP